LKNSLFLEAILDPAGILILISSVISGLLAAWWLFPAGIFLWLVMALVIMRDPSMRINNAIQNRSELTQRFQDDFNRLQKSQVSFFNIIQSSEPGIQHEMMPINEAITDLLNLVYENCRRYSLLENHRMVSVTDQKMGSELASIETRLQTPISPDERIRLERLQKTLSEKVTQQQTVTNQLNAYSEQMAMLQVDLDGLITEVIQSQSAGEDQLKKIVPEIVKKINQLKQESEKQ
jgi:hypothetical protein